MKLTETIGRFREIHGVPLLGTFSHYEFYTKFWQRSSEKEYANN